MGRPAPVGVKVFIEGPEEVGGGAFTTYPPRDPALFAADVMLIGDMGNVRPGTPTLTVGLRGMANLTVEVRTLASAKHSGQCGAAPDALLALMRALASLHDAAGDVAVAGLRREEWTGGGPGEAEFRPASRGRRRGSADRHRDPGLAGVVRVGDQVIGVDVPSLDKALNAVSPYARAKLNVRCIPSRTPRRRRPPS